MNKKTLRKVIALLAFTAVVAPLSAATSNGFRYSATSGGVKITRYTGTATTVAIPSTLGGKSVVTIGEDAFEENRTIVTLTIPSTVTKIAEGAFSEMTRLKYVTIEGGASLRIGENAFSECYALRSVTFLGAPPTFYTTDNDWDDYIFEDTPSTAIGIYPEAYATQWQAVVNAYGRWQGLRMLVSTDSAAIAATQAAASAATVSGTSTVTATDSNPAFTDGDTALALYKNFSVEESFAIDGLAGGSVTLKKTSGRLPSGLKFKYDKATGAAVLSGRATRAGSYTATYTVTERVGRVRTTSAPLTLYIDVTDPATIASTDADYNATFGQKITSTILVTSDDGLSAGSLKVSITKAGKISAKLTGLTRSAISWSGYWQTNDAGTLGTTLVKKGVTLTLSVTPDGAMTASVSGLSTGGSATTTEAAALVTSGNYANYAGTYTVALEQDGYRNYGTLTLKMTGSSFLKSGTVSYSGKLPNGVSFSGSATFTPDTGWDDGFRVGQLYIYKSTSSYTLALKVEVSTNGEVEDADGFDSFYKTSSGVRTEIEIED